MRYWGDIKVCDQASSISTPLCLHPAYRHYQRGPLDLNQPLLTAVRWPAVIMTEPLSLWQREAEFIRPVRAVKVIVKSYRFSHVAKCAIYTVGQPKSTVNCAVYGSRATVVQCNDDGQYEEMLQILGKKVHFTHFTHWVNLLMVGRTALMTRWKHYQICDSGGSIFKGWESSPDDAIFGQGEENAKVSPKTCFKNCCTVYGSMGIYQAGKV